MRVALLLPVATIARLQELLEAFGEDSNYALLAGDAAGVRLSC